MRRRTLSSTFGVIIVVIIAALSATITIPSSLFQKTISVAVDNVGGIVPVDIVQRQAAPIATSRNNAYIVWSSNKTTPDFEVMFRASTDGGKTFGPKINLSNSTGIDSERPEIAASGNNVYVSWWERNSTSNDLY